MGSDPHAVQDDFEKLFDAINRVTFDEQNRKLIIEITMIMGAFTESVQLTDHVQAEGNIEDWLVKLEKSMQASVRLKCKSGAQECMAVQSGSRTIKDYTISFPSQIALLGIQILWTQAVGECLDRSNKEKIIELEKKKKFLRGLLNDLTAMCLEEWNKVERTRIETMVTIHVRQIEIYDEIRDEAKNHRIKDSNDFAWTKNTRCEWRNDDQHVGVNITDVTFTYSYEFLGAKERLCITPLTDRCYVTLAQALGMLYGGAPAGPAGTGKTQTKILTFFSKL